MSKIIDKECKIHGMTKHRIYLENKSILRHRCNKCATIAVQKRRDKLKILAVQYKGGKCEHCGYSKCVGALHFHHLDPKEKDFGIASKGYTRSWEKVKIELDKCILVCANCHSEIHHEESR